MYIDPKLPYNNLPSLPPSFDLETLEVMRMVARARASLAEMKGVSKLLPNQSMLVNYITLREAQDSSKIENIGTTQDDLYLAFASDLQSIDPQVKEVLNYKEALSFGFKELQNNGLLTSNQITRIHEKIVSKVAGIRAQTVTILKNSKTREVVYTPPEGRVRISNLLHNLETYINIDDNGVDPLIKLAVIHYQFETIHPFHDGNGRTGRIINILYLVLKGLIDFPTLYLSSYLIQNKMDYYRLLGEMRVKGNWDEWVLFILKGIDQTAQITIHLIESIRRLINEAEAEIKDKMPRAYSIELVELLFEQPYCKASFLVKRGICERRTAMKYLKELETLGLLKEVQEGNQKLFLNVKLFELLKTSS